MRSAGPRRSVSRCRLRRTSGSLSSLDIEPDTSTRKTRLRPRTASRSRLRSRSGMSAARTPTSASRCSSFHGQAPDFGRDRDRRVAGRRRVVEAEVVDELLDADRAFGRQPPFAEHPPDVGVGRRVDVGRERRPRMRADAMEAGLRQVTVGLAIEPGSASSPPRWPGCRDGTAGLDRTVPLDTVTISARAPTSSRTAIVVVRPETTVTVVCSVLNPVSSTRTV